MPQNSNNYTFEISLSVLNHLGRNLYRSFITVLGEGISNSWDADAKNVWIYIDRDNGNFVIKDDGVGMDSKDFQNKFLKVGYSKRKIEAGGIKSAGGRPYIGAKGIGKLALLSCADRVSIISKREGGEYTGGVIDNSGLDEAIEQEMTPDQYSLEGLNTDQFTSYAEDHNKGTIILFENTKENIRNTIPYLRKLIALHFKFSLIDKGFTIYVEDEPVTATDLQDVADKTEFLWNINECQDPYISNNLTSLKESGGLNVDSTTSKGFIASVEKPSHLKIAGSDEKAGIDLFVNGRLREKDVLKHMPDFSTRFVASYLYGQIHFDDLDTDVTDKVFTSSREGVVDDNEEYKNLLNIIKSEILEHITGEWDVWRLKHDQIGDEDNEKNKGKKERYARSLFKESAGSYTNDNGGGSDWIKDLRDDAEFNLPAYTDCFLSENLLRRHIREEGLVLEECVKKDGTGQSCKFYMQDSLERWCQFCKAEQRQNSLQAQKTEANTAIQIRDAEDDLLVYLDYVDLAKTINDTVLKDEDRPYKPLRNSVMHTALLTQEAKTRLRAVFDNVSATVRGLFGEGH